MGTTLLYSGLVFSSLKAIPKYLDTYIGEYKCN